MPPPLTETHLKTLKQAATAAKATAHCPYSNFRVGAALLLADEADTIITGANVENAAYPVGTCAERVALGTAVTRAAEVPVFRALAVASDVSPPASPCGMCRQFIREFCSLSMPIYMFDKDGNHVLRTLEELLPMSFGPEDLVKG